MECQLIHRRGVPGDAGEHERRPAEDGVRQEAAELSEERRG